MSQYVRVSPRDPRYLELSDGTPYIPNGLNVVHPGGDVSTAGRAGPDGELDEGLADNGGNYIRIWLSSTFWDLERQRAGVFDEQRAQRVDALLELARATASG